MRSAAREFDIFDGVSLEALRKRRSEKWAVYPEDVLPAFVAEMDVPLADPIRDALLEAIEIGDTGYPNERGLREAFVEFARMWSNWQVDPRRVVMVPDVMAGAAAVIRLVTKPGDPVVINPPVYPPFFKTIVEDGRRLAEVPLRRDTNGWDLDLEGLEEAFRSGARAYLLCNPHNPTGRVFTRPQLERIAELADRYGVFVISDEIHAFLTLPGAAHVPFVSLGDDAARRAVTVTSASKAWNIAGLKCAVVIAGSDDVRARLTGLPSLITDGAGHLGVVASIAAFHGGAPWLRLLLRHLDRNRRLLAELLVEQLPAVRYEPPEATYLAWLDCRALELGADPAVRFLERGRVALSRGLDFGAEGAGFVRLNMGTSAEILIEIVARMAASLA